MGRRTTGYRFGATDRHGAPVNPWERADLCGDPGPATEAEKRHKGKCLSYQDLDSIDTRLAVLETYFEPGGDCRGRVRAAREVVWGLRDLWTRS